MTNQTWLAFLFVAGLAVLVWGLHTLAWRLLHTFTSAMERLSALPEPRAWAQVRPLHAWLRFRHPGLHRNLAARLTRSRFTGLPLTLLVLGALYLAALLGGLTEEVIEAGSVLRFDQAVNAVFQPLREGPLVPAFIWITALGAGPALTVVAVTATGFLWISRRFALILPLWVAFLGAQATTWSGKYLIARHRPDFIEAVTEANPSFPSGHATASMALYGFLAYALVRDVPSRLDCFEIVFWSTTLIAAIGFSRVFLSVHYTTDVVAGFMVGAFWLLAGFALAERGRGRSATAPSPQGGQSSSSEAVR